MPDGFQAEVLGALRELREGVDRVEAALALVRQDLGARMDRLRDDMLVATTIATGAEERAEERAEGTRTIVRDLLRREQELRRRVEKLEERDRERGP